MGTQVNPLSLSLSCAGSAVLSSAYFVIWITRNNIPMTYAPFINTTCTGFQTENINYAAWDLSELHPAATKGVWNPSTTYASGDTVESSQYRMLSSDGSINIPIVYRSRAPGNKGNSPENFDGKWTCMTQPDSVPNKNFPVVPFAYALNPLPSKSDLSTAKWTGEFWHSLVSGIFLAPGDVLQLIDVYIKLNYLLGTAIVPTISRPLAYSASPNGTYSKLINPGINAQFQTWKTGLGTYPVLTLNGFDLSAFLDGFQPGATAGTAYLSALAASGGTPPYAYAIIAGSLPAGVTLNGTTGVISGTPVASGIFNFTAQVTDSTGATATATCAAPMQCGGGGAAKGNAFY